MPSGGQLDVVITLRIQMKNINDSYKYDTT